MNSSELRPYHIDAIKLQFELLEDPKSHLINEESCNTLFRSLGQAVPERLLRQKVKELLAKSQEGELLYRYSCEAVNKGVSFDQFLAFFCENYQTCPSEDGLIHVFHSLDRHHTGYINTSLLTQVLKVGQTPLTEEQINFFFQKITPVCGVGEGQAIDYARAAYE
eukprot:Gregarina_sp_Poly_1__193@NODE_1044_length_5263_cov_228_474596_g724_i0_p3_GENE_NODE_1044_length_5263_cov_228_474596_g724_i0NODE_1044_length_5263_cov_228_474596_g724_i0_p3_ORF_typecomplete_len165_score13_80EFhand_7/PF13499_6/4e02EFhand_7/PF13499_6/0_00016EFhand_11/PF08976_11/1_8e02EFhand_11/PF08976_11/0_008DAG_kinase_N/PF14513_6/0_15EFhand_8/PF13833_6/7_4e02EFhand_8/PF13833_6/29EFhand_8/PF13833_6/16EFhand_6/PF13405_6/0_3_NODE_1044_length_5263_cov_228_474596_g724_i021122606